MSVKWKGEGDIYNPQFLGTLRKVTDDVFFINGVSRASVTSLFTANVRYIEITEDGIFGDVVVPPRFTGSVEDLAQVRSNAARSGQVGRLVANDLKSAMVRADLQDIDPRTGQAVSYVEVAQRLEAIRDKYSSDQVEINIVGFAKLVGDVVEGLMTVIGFFIVAFLITGLLLWLYSRSLRLTVVALLVALLPVVWLLGLLPLMGLGIDPMSILVPFLIFSIGVSHAVQMTNAWKQEVIAGQQPVQAAHLAFCKIFIPGSLALLMNALGFAVIMLIDIPIVHELGVTACIGVMLMIITNKLMLPIIISHLRLESRLLVAKVGRPQDKHTLWWRLSALAEPGPALAVLVVSVLLLSVAMFKARQLEVGDIGAGAPELRADSRYNQDNAKLRRCSRDALRDHSAAEHQCLGIARAPAVEHCRPGAGHANAAFTLSLATACVHGTGLLLPVRRWANRALGVSRASGSWPCAVADRPGYRLRRPETAGRGGRPAVGAGG